MTHTNGLFRVILICITFTALNGENMKIICLEENYLDSELGRACMPVALEQAPFLGDWGKTVADGHNPDRLPAFPL